MAQENMTEYANKLYKIIGCNCDLDKWEPEKITGHSCVCNVHLFLMPLYFCNDEAFEKEFNNIIEKVSKRAVK